MSAAEAREQLEAAVRQQATYLEPHTGRYKCAVTEDGMQAILRLADTYAGACAGDSVADAINGLARQRRAEAAEASAAEHRERLEQATGAAPPAAPPAERTCGCGAAIPRRSPRGRIPWKCPDCIARGKRAWWRDYRRRQRASARCPDCGAARPDHLITCARATGEAS
jgi:predicted RNA-binding Zn-ribbon protein involved in translation (DUF1610 family)